MKRGEFKHLCEQRSNVDDPDKPEWYVHFKVYGFSGDMVFLWLVWRPGGPEGDDYRNPVRVAEITWASSGKASLGAVESLAKCLARASKMGKEWELHGKHPRRGTREDATRFYGSTQHDVE